MRCTAAGCDLLPTSPHTSNFETNNPREWISLPRFKRDAVIFDALLLLYDERVSHEESVSQTIRPLALPFGDDLILVVSCSKILVAFS